MDTVRGEGEGYVWTDRKSSLLLTTVSPQKTFYYFFMCWIKKPQRMFIQHQTHGNVKIFDFYSTRSFIPVCDKHIPHHFYFLLLVKSYCTLSTLLSRPKSSHRIPSHPSNPPLQSPSSPPLSEFLPYSRTSPLIDKTHIWYLEVCASSDFEAVQMCQTLFWWKWDSFLFFFFSSRAGLPFETFCSVFPMTEQRRGLSASASATGLSQLPDLTSRSPLPVDAPLPVAQYTETTVWYCND